MVTQTNMDAQTMHNTDAKAVRSLKVISLAFLIYVTMEVTFVLLAKALHGDIATPLTQSSTLLRTCVLPLMILVGTLSAKVESLSTARFYGLGIGLSFAISALAAMVLPLL